MRIFKYTVIFLLSAILVTGCATPQQVKKLEDEISLLQGKLRDAEIQREEEIKRLKEGSKASQERLKASYDSQLKRLELEKRKEETRLKEAKDALAKDLQKELSEYKAKLEMTERGLIITFLAEVFFDSGKDIIRQEGFAVLDKVAKILNEKVSDSPVAIEGHTDNEPIKYSNWLSNWELSAHRALAVLHYFIDKCNIDPKRLSANGYGEYRPIATNDTKEGRQKNRRVEIVIAPSKLTKQKSDF